MPANGPTGAEALSRIRNFAQLFQYLIDVLGWPLETDDLEEEDLVAITYDWGPEELGIPRDRLSDLRRLQQMRPLTADQPWGVFFLEFAGSRLPITQVRRLLGSLVKKKRVTGNARRRAWSLDDLLFIVITGVDDSMQLHLLAFRGDDPRSAGFLPLAWRPAQSPTRHLRRLAEELLPRLSWPDDDHDIKSWRNAWREPFELPAGQPIKDAARLAEKMAKTARDLRDQIGKALENEQGSGPFSTLMEEIRTRLVSDVNEKRFADMCAQTLVYGLLSSRVTDPDGFGASPTFSIVPLANPFLESFFEQVHDEAALLDLSGSGLPQLVADLARTSVEEILDQFGSTVKGGDPVIHFYEEFLKQYDPKLRADAGAFYTPKPVVECMVRLVDEVLRSRFSLPLGIADHSSWAEVAECNGFTVPDGVDPTKPFVSMIDPATGTGTFLIEWIRRAHHSFLESDPEGDWPQHLRVHVLPSMHAFESMLASYAIAHLKVALELHDHRAGGDKMQILLTDTLDHVGYQGQFDIMSDPVAEEGKRSFALKESRRFTVVIGNPPYYREQRAIGDTSKRKGGVVRYGAPGREPLIKEITEPMKSAGLGKHLKNIYNDYIYFWRWAVWQATELPDGPGIVAFITASSYLDGVSMGGMRDMLRKAFDELLIIDLGGEGRGAHIEPNIFDILTPVAVAVGIRTGQSKPSACAAKYLRITGTREDKFTALNKISVSDISENIAGTGLERIKPRIDHIMTDWPYISDIFPWVWSGCQVKRTWPIGETSNLLQHRWSTLLDEVPRHRNILLRKTDARHVRATPDPLLENGPKLKALHELGDEAEPESVERYGYRSFDRQWIIADHRLADSPKPILWRIRGPNQVFLTTLTSTSFGHGPIFTATPYVPDLHHFRGSNCSKNTIPLYCDAKGKSPNITHGLLEALNQRMGFKISPEDLLAYVYALGGTSAFSGRYADILAGVAEPAHIPITSHIPLFKRAVALGHDLLWWHTWGERFLPEGQSTLPAGHAQVIQHVDVMPYKRECRYDPHTQKLSVGTGVFGPVSPEVWNYKVSGYQVLKSWLEYRVKDRKGRRSSLLDDIRPDRWTQTDELLRLLAILEHTVEVTPAVAQLLEEIVSGPLILAKDLPQPTDTQRRPPKL